MDEKVQLKWKLMYMYIGFELLNLESYAYSGGGQSSGLTR